MARYLVLTITFLFAQTVMSTEEPKYVVLLEQEPFELRQYESIIVAEVTVKGDMRRASSRGFRALADFIFGNNRHKGSNTSPPESQKIAMTAPVTRVPAADQSWVIAFVMPDKYSMESLPVPNNSSVSIREQSAQLIASVTFSGLGRESSHKQKQQALEQWLADNGYKSAGAPRYAGYNPPWTLPALRRNEVLIPVVAANSVSKTQ